MIVVVSTVLIHQMCNALTVIKELIYIKVLVYLIVRNHISHKIQIEAASNVMMIVSIALDPSLINVQIAL